MITILRLITFTLISLSGGYLFDRAYNIPDPSIYHFVVMFAALGLIISGVVGIWLIMYRNVKNAVRSDP